MWSSNPARFNRSRSKADVSRPPAETPCPRAPTTFDCVRPAHVVQVARPQISTNVPMVVPLFSTKKRCHWESPSLMGFRATELSYLGLIQLSLPGPRNELQCECTLTRSHDNVIYAPRQHRLLPNVRNLVEIHSAISVTSKL